MPEQPYPSKNDRATFQKEWRKTYTAKGGATKFDDAKFQATKFEPTKIGATKLGRANQLREK